MPSYDLLDEAPVSTRPKHDLLDEEPVAQPQNKVPKYDILDEPAAEVPAPTPISESERLLKNVGGQEEYDKLLAQNQAERFAQSPSPEEPTTPAPAAPTDEQRIQQGWKTQEAVRQQLLKEKGPDFSKEEFKSRLDAAGVPDEVRDFDVINTPLVTLPKPEGDEYAGLRRFEENVEGLTTLPNIAMGAGLGGVAAKAVGITFGVMALKHASEVAPEIVKKASAGDWTGTGESLVDLGVAGLMVAAAAHSVARPKISRAIIEKTKTASTEELQKFISDPKFSELADERLAAQREILARGAVKSPEVVAKEIQEKPGTPLEIAANAATLAPNTAEAARAAAEVQNALVAKIKALGEAQKATRDAEEAAKAKTPKEEPKAEVTKEEALKEPTSPIAGPALLDSDGKIIVQGNIGQTHAELMVQAAKDGIDATDAEHGFLDETGKPLNREEAAKVADETGQRVSGKGPLHSQHLIAEETPLSQDIIDGFWQDETKGSKEKLKTLIESNVSDEQIIKAVGGNFGKPELAKFKRENGLEKISIPETATAPSASPVRQILDSAIQNHSEELQALGHPKEFASGKDETGAGLWTDPVTGQIHIDEARLEQQSAKMTPEARETVIRRLVAEEVFHSATVAFAKESAANEAKLLSLLDDKELVARTREAYGDTFDSKTDFAKAAEAARVLAQGKEGLTEASYKFLKDMLAWLEQKVKNLTPETKQLLTEIRAKMGKFEEEQVKAEKSEYRPPLPRKALADRFETAGVTNDVFTEPQIIELHNLTDKHADSVSSALGITDQNSPFWIAAKDELELRARKFLKKNGTLEGFGWTAIEGTVKSEITGTRDWDEHLGNIDLDAPLSDGADSLLDMLHQGKVEESALTPDQKKHLREAEARALGEEGSFLAAIKDPEFLKTLNPIEKQIASIAKAPNSTLKEAYTDRLEEMAAAQGDAESVIQDATRTLNDKTAQYGKSYDAQAGPRDTAAKARPKAGPKVGEKAKEVAPEEPVGGPGAMGPQEASEMSAKASEGATALKRATVDAEREARGAEPIPTPVRETTESVVQRAEDLRDKDTTAGAALVAKILDGDTAISRDEAALLLVERKRLQNEKNEWLDKIGRDESVAEAQSQVLRLEEELDRVDQAQRAAGSAWSDVGRLYQENIREDYTLEALKRKYRAAKSGAKEGRDLTDAEVNKLREQANEIAKLEREVERLQTEVQDAETNADVTRMYEATIHELGPEYLEKPQFGKEVLDIARKTVDRWKKEAEGLDTEIARMLKSESGSVGGTGGAGGQGRKLGGAPIANASLVTNIAKVIRARVGEAVLTKAEMLAELVDKFGEKIRPLFDKSWKEAHRLIEADAHTDTIKKAVKATAQKNTDAEALKKSKARAKADAVAGEALTQKRVVDMVKSLIKSGVHGEDAVMKAAYEGLKEAFPNITERDVRRAFTNYGEPIFPNPEAVATETRELKSLVRLQESIERELAGLAGNIDPETGKPFTAKRTGIQRDKATQSIREKTKLLNELLKKRKADPSPEQLASREEAKITALNNRIADINKELETGIRQQKTEPLPDSDAVQTLKAEKQAMQDKLDEIRNSEKDVASPVEKQVTALERQKKDIEDRLAGITEKDKPKEFTALSQRAENLKAEILALQQLSKELRAKPSADPVDAQIERMKKQRDLVRDRLAGIEPAKSPQQFNALSAEAESLKGEILAMQQLAKEIRDAAKVRKSPIDRQIESLEKQKENIDKQLSGLSAKKTTVGFKALSAAAESLKAEIQAMQDLQKELTAEDRYNTTRMKAVDARMAELDERLRTRNFAPKPKNAPPIKREPLRKAEEALGRKKLEVDREAEKERLKNRTGVEKTLDSLAQWNRAFILSGPSTLLKLTSAATEIIGLNPIEEAIGGAISKVAPKLAEKSERHGKFSGAAEAKAIAATFKNLFKDIGDELKTGQMDIDVAHGKKGLAPIHFTDFIAHVHGALKSPARRNEFTRSFEKRITAAARRGENVSDPLVQARTAADAYKDANRSIFMEDNMVVDAYKWALRRLEQPSKENGRPSFRGKLAATGLKYTLPVVRIPTNIVSRVFEYSLGHLAATGRFGLNALEHRVGGEPILRTLSKSIERMTPDQADAIMRNLKRGSLGTALLLLGYFNADNVGGYYHQGEKREKDEAQFGGLRLFGHNVPRILVHNPALEQLQIGATVRRYVDSLSAKGGDKLTGIASGALAAGVGVLDETPFTSELMNSARALESFKGKSSLGAAGEFIGKEAENLVPQIIQQPAKFFDKDEEGEPIKRKPETIAQHIKQVIPGLRKNVPEREEKPDHEGVVKALESNNFAMAKEKLQAIQDSSGVSRAKAISDVVALVDRPEHGSKKKDQLYEAAITGEKLEEFRQRKREREARAKKLESDLKGL